LSGASSLGWQHLAWPTVASVSSPRARGDDAAFAQQALLQASRDRAIAVSDHGNLVLILFWLSQSVITQAGILLFLPPAPLPLPGRGREAEVCASGGREGYREDVEHHGILLVVAASASCSHATCDTCRCLSASHSHRRVSSRAWMRRASRRFRSAIDTTGGGDTEAGARWATEVSRAAQSTAADTTARVTMARITPPLRAAGPPEAGW